jgi:hypothetical protein
MNEENLSEEERIKKAHTELIAKRDEFVKKLVPALVDQGFNVTGLPLPTDRWQVGQLTATKPEVKRDFKMLFVFEIKGTGWHRKMPSKLVLKFGQDMGYRGHATRYTKLDANLATALTSATQAQLNGAAEYEKRRVKEEQDKADFSYRRVMELAGYLNPPGTEINIVNGNGPIAGKYTVRFHPGSITNTYLTRDQVVRLMDVLNEIQGSTDALIIVSRNKDNGSEYSWNSYGWCSSGNLNPTLFATQEEAEAELLRAKEKSNRHDTVEIVRYDSRFTIKPGNPVNR